MTVTRFQTLQECIDHSNELFDSIVNDNDNDDYFEQELSKFYKKLLDSQQDLDPDLAKVIEENFWDLV